MAERFRSKSVAGLSKSTNVLSIKSNHTLTTQGTTVRGFIYCIEPQLIIQADAASRYGLIQELTFLPDSSHNFSLFEFSTAQIASLQTDFSLLISETDLSRCNSVDRIIADYKQVSGVYFWVMCHGEKVFRIYIGKTKSMSYRMQNYIGEFQPHSPNDYKLRIFHAFLAESIPGATLDLYFSPKNLNDLTKAENLALVTYDPLLNRRQRPSVNARAALRDAFSGYYRSAFEKLLQNDR